MTGPLDKCQVPLGFSTATSSQRLLGVFSESIRLSAPQTYHPTLYLWASAGCYLIETRRRIVNAARRLSVSSLGNLRKCESIQAIMRDKNLPYIQS